MFKYEHIYIYNRLVSDRCDISKRTKTGETGLGLDTGVFEKNVITSPEKLNWGEDGRLKKTTTPNTRPR